MILLPRILTTIFPVRRRAGNCVGDLASLGGTAYLSAGGDGCELDEAKADHLTTASDVIDLPVLPLMHPPSVKTFYKVLRHAGVRYTRHNNETQCDLHTNGKIWERELEAAMVEATTKGPSDRGRVVLNKRIRDLRVKVAEWHLHEEQSATQRAHVEDIKSNLQPRQAVVYRDFVNMYMKRDGEKSGNQLKDLQLVVMWRDKLGEDLKVVKLSHLCSDRETYSCDSFFTADVFDYQLSPPDDTHEGFLNKDKFDKLYIVGDHGPHFSAKETVWHESQFQERYGVEVESVFLCSYHAYNRCDAAGLEVKRLGEWAAAHGVPLNSAVQYAAAMNTSPYVDHLATPFEQICRNADKFPKNLSTPRAGDWILRKVCHIKYPRIGVVLMYVVSGKMLSGVHQFDLTAPETVCGRCSLSEQKALFHPVKQRCPRAETMYLVDRTKGTAPGLLRIKGGQLSKKKGGGIVPPRAAPGKKKPPGKFPCKYIGCSNLFYASAAWCNKHMTSKHPGGRLTPWPESEKAAAGASGESDSEFESASEEEHTPAPVEKPLTAIESIQAVAKLHVSDDSILEAMELTPDWLGEQIVAVQATECVWGTLVDTHIDSKFPDWPHFRIHVDPECAALWRKARRRDKSYKQ